MIESEFFSMYGFKFHLLLQIHVALRALNYRARCTSQKSYSLMNQDSSLFSFKCDHEYFFLPNFQF